MSPSITVGTKDQPFLTRELLLGTSAFGITINGQKDSAALAAPFLSTGRSVAVSWRPSGVRHLGP